MAAGDEKKEVALALLEAQPSVFVHLDPRRSGVVVPKWLATSPTLTLQIGLAMRVPIPDLVVDEAGIVATLSFQRSPFTCRVPWAAVFAIVGEDRRGRMWEGDVPTDLEVPEKTPTAPRPKLRVAGGTDTAPRPTPVSAPEPPREPPPSRPRGHLRRVK